MKYLKVKEYLKKIIDKSEQGTKLPTEAEIVSALNVSRITVRKSMEILENEGLITKIQGSGAFVSKSFYKICLVYNKSIDLYKDPFYSNLIHKLERELYNNKCIVELLSLDDDTDFSLLDADGIIILSMVTDKIFDLDIPKLVLFEGGYSEKNLSCVLADEYSGGKNLCDYLYKKGFDKILFAGNNKFYSSKMRFEGARDFAKNKLELILLNTKMNITGGKPVAEKLKEENISCVICANDWLALGTIRECENLGLNVPCDVSCVSFDNTFLSSVCHPSITSMDLPIDKGVALGVKEIKELILNKNKEKVKIYLPLTLIEKESVI